MISLEIHTDNPMVKLINEQTEYLGIIKSELEVRMHHLQQPVQGEPTFEKTIGSIDNAKAILATRLEIASKESFIQELKLKLIQDDDNVVSTEYPDFKLNRKALFEKLNGLTESGYKTEIHKNHFAYLRADLSTYERMLADAESDKHSIESTIGIKRGIVIQYTRLLYAIDEHSKYTG